MVLLFFVLLLAGCQGGVQPENSGALKFVTVHSQPMVDKPNRSAQYDETELDKSFQIKGENQTLTTRVKFYDGNLIAGGIKVENSPLQKVECSPCEVTLDRRYHPNGATQWLELKNNSDRTLIVSSYQPRFSALGWMFSHIDNQIKITEQKTRLSTVISNRLTAPVSLNSKNTCSVLWANKRFLKQPLPHIANDVAKFRSQFILQCSN